ncbi:hypothetical protein TREES_T100019257 [Tupaia chinensis]|uniref:Uncharacterized protein n=1 Tax=Tupaia chinensis TaxID=246437 RepID=L9L9U7_TUPCH|nr:hypothetical protein TREES_T100019257 [Tupaia chinensis]
MVLDSFALRGPRGQHKPKSLGSEDRPEQDSKERLGYGVFFKLEEWMIATVIPLQKGGKSAFSCKNESKATNKKSWGPRGQHKPKSLGSEDRPEQDSKERLGYGVFFKLEEWMIATGDHRTT